MKTNTPNNKPKPAKKTKPKKQKWVQLELPFEDKQQPNSADRRGGD